MAVLSIGALITAAKSKISIGTSLSKLSLKSPKDFKKLLKIARALNIDTGDIIGDEETEEEIAETQEPQYNLHWFRLSEWIESAKYIPDKEETLMIVTFKNSHGPLVFDNFPYDKYQNFITAPSAGKYYKKNLEYKASTSIKGFDTDLSSLFPKEVKQGISKAKQAINAANNPLKFAKGQGMGKVNRIKGVSQMKNIKKIGGKL